MTKKQMQEKLQEEFNVNYELYKFFKERGNEDAACPYWIRSDEESFWLRELFGVDALQAYLDGLYGTSSIA